MCGLCDCANCVIYLLCVVVYNIIFHKVREKGLCVSKKKMLEFSGGGKINWCDFSITENERKGGK